MTYLTDMKQMNQDIEQCIQNCLDCHSFCLNTIAYCLQQGHTEQAHLRLMMDCAEICQTSANFMLRGSDFHGRICEVCTEICDRCAKNCAQFENDEQMQDCADICRRCAQSCQQMSMTTA